MKALQILAGLVLAVWVLAAAPRGEAGWGWPQFPTCCTCCDDYHAKKLCLPCVHNNCGPDDYCRKSLPPCPPTSCGVCDDYVPKCCPIHIPPACGPYYSCGSPESPRWWACPPCGR